MKRLLLLMLFLPVVATAQTNNHSLSDLVQECMKRSENGSDRKLAIWFPTIFWEQIGEQLNLDPEALRVIVEELDQYMFFAVVDYRMQVGDLTFQSEAQVLSTITFKDSSGRAQKPVSRAALSETAKAILRGMEPTLSKILGQFGSGMVLVFFRAPSAGSGVAYNPARPNRFELSWGTSGLIYNLPLAAALPARHCPVDGAEMQGNWNYCPFHGKKL